MSLAGVTPRVERESALVKSVHAMDAARRVGWGKYFTETDKNDELSRDLNMARSDNDLIARFAGYLYGMLTVAAPGTLAKLPPTVNRLGVIAMLPDSSLDAGRRACRGLSRSQRARRVNEREKRTEEILSQRDKPPGFDRPVGDRHNVSDAESERPVVVRATTKGGLLIDRPPSPGKRRRKSGIYFSPTERARLLDALNDMAAPSSENGKSR